MKKGNIWGPAYTGIGDNSSGLGSGQRDYPTLLGPEPKDSKMVEGGGVFKKRDDKAGLPGSASTGSNEDSKYFGSSRVPGDKDMYPGYFDAGGSAYSASSGSFKTDPVPFLADFSAFLR
jgi:hypothetical protein